MQRDEHHDDISRRGVQSSPESVAVRRDAERLQRVVQNHKAREDAHGHSEQEQKVDDPTNAFATLAATHQPF